MATPASQQADQQPDSWAEIEQAALAAFSTYINTSAPGLVAVIRRSVRYAKVESPAREIIIDRRAVVLGVIVVGLETPERSRGSTANWLTSWLRRKVKLDAARVASLGSGTDSLLDAFHSGCRVVASQSMRALLPRAVDYAERTCKRSTADLRHIVAAMIATQYPDWPEFSDFSWRPSAADIAELRRVLLERISERPEEGEDLTAWQEILGADATEAAAPTARRAQEISVVSLSADRPAARREGEAADDPLRVDADVQAFANLICLDEAVTPLSIGLFGGWGSGKTTFMERLEDAVRDIATREQARRSDPAQQQPVPAGPRFISNVVQIRFNAWQFADANLWASLTAEFFDQLRSGGYRRLGDVRHSELVERVNAHVHSLSDALATARAALARGERALVAAQAARDQARQEADKAQGAMISQTLVDAVSTAYEKHKADLAGVTKDVDAFVKVTDSLRKTGGRFLTIWEIVKARGWPFALLVLTAAVAFALLAMLPFIDASAAADRPS
jgi:hypothetical protein